MSLKDTRIIDLNLFSGSSELMRQALGGHYYDSGAGQIEFKAVGVEPIVQIEKFIPSEMSPYSDSILPKKSYITRIFVNESSTDIVSDENWKKFIIGGDFADKTYPGIYNENVYPDHFNSSSLPLLPRELVNTERRPSLILTTEYFNYYPRFQGDVANLQSELMAPNYYMLPDIFFSQSTDTNSCIAETLYPQVSSFLTNSFVNSTKTYDSMLENIFIVMPSGFDERSLSWYHLNKSDDLAPGHMDSDLQKLYSLMPFGNKLQIRRDLANTETKYRDIIESNQYEIKLLKLLKETFQGESSLPTVNTNFIVNTKAEISTGAATGLIESTNTVPIKIVDAPTMLIYGANNPISETNNITVFRSGSYSSTMDYVFDTGGVYRFENTSASYAVLNQFVDQIKDSFPAEPITYPLSKFYNQAGNEKYHETLAFRIEKIGGGPTGDSNTENTIQNIWFYNVNRFITYFDTQVKYDTEYTYKIYKYDIVQGYRYQLSDILTTRQIATTTSGDTNVYCLEFYDPFTGQTSNQLFEENRTTAELTALSSSLETQRVTTEGQIVNILSTLHADKNTLINNYYVSTGASSPKHPETGIPPDPRFFGKFIDFYEGIFGPRVGTPKPLLDSTLYSYFENIKNYIDSRLDGEEAKTDGIETEAQSFEGVFAEANIQGVLSQVLEIIDITVSSFIERVLSDFSTYDRRLETELVPIQEQLAEVQVQLDIGVGSLRTHAQINSSYPRLADFKISIEPSLKIIEIPLEEKRMRIVDHPPNDFVITPHHLLDQSNRLAFYCKYDTFSMNSATYPPTINTRDQQNKSAYLIGNDFIETSEQTQESVSRPRFIEVYRTTTKPTRYSDFAGSLHKTVDLRQPNGDIPTDHLFVERVRENIKYYYAFRALNENSVAGQISPVFEAELINDGGYVYGAFNQFSEEDLAVAPPKEPLKGFKKLLNIIPNIQHLQLDTSTATFASSSISQLSEISLGSGTQDTLWDDDKYYKIRLTSKKTGKKIDLNISFKKEERK